MSRTSIVVGSMLAALVGSHVVVFLCTVRLLNPRRFLTRGLLLLFFLLLPFTFPAAWVWRERAPGLGPALLHASSSIWLAFVLNLMMCLAVVLGFAGIVRLFKRRVRTRALVLLASGLAFALTLCGHINTRFPRVKEVRVPIRDLPGYWQGRTIVHLTDVHLGLIQGPGFLNRLVAKVNALEPDLIVITGDLFDGLVPDCGVFVPGLSRFRSRHGVYFVMGNHEGYIGVQRALNALEQTPIGVLDDRVVNIHGLQLVGVGYPVFGRKTKGQTLVRKTKTQGLSLAGYDRAMPTILLYHTPTGLDTAYADEHTQQMRTYFFPEPDFSVAEEMGIDLQLSGHTHAGQTFPFGLLTRLLYRGYDRGLHRFDDFALYISAGTGTWGPPIRIGQNSEIALIRLELWDGGP